MSQITLTIDNKEITVPEGTTILDAAKNIGIKIPTLCYHPDQKIKANCRLCLVEVEGERTLVTACSNPVREGIKIKTFSEKVRKTRKTILELMLSNHDYDCLNCTRNGLCELQELAREFGIEEKPFRSILNRHPLDKSTPSLVRDPNKCIKCGRCEELCQEKQHVSIIASAYRSKETQFTTPFGKELSDVPCILCGQCSTVCPVGAIYERNATTEVWNALEDNDMHVVVQTAPAIRIGIGEEFGFETGSVTTGKLVAALKRLGFDTVFDTCFTADLTIIEEGNELIDRITNNGTLPMITSCSPGWINYIERYYPDLLPHLSTCKSPQQMFGALAKTYYAEKTGIAPEKIFVVSIMPCTAKKYEAAREEMNDSGYRDVDAVLTTRELAKMIRQSGILFEEIEPEEYDNPMGISTGAAVIFGTTGGVMEAALRTVYEVLTGKELKNIELNEVRGLTGIKEATVKINDLEVKVAIAHGIANAQKIMELIEKGAADYHFIEIMACPSGCIGGGGQPYGTTDSVRNKRNQGTYQADRDLKIRKSHENPAVTQLYKEFLKKPLGQKSHKLLHTHYKDRKPTFKFI